MSFVSFAVNSPSCWKELQSFFYSATLTLSHFIMVGVEGFEPPLCLLPKQVPYQARRNPGRLVPPPRLELGTIGLKVRCSTN